MSIWPFKDTAHPQFQRFSKAERRTIFDACCDIITIDAEVTEDEVGYLIRVGELLGYKPLKTAKLFKKAHQDMQTNAGKRGYRSAQNFSKLPRKDVELFVTLITAVLADDRVKPEEEVLIQRFGELLGFSKSEIQEILDSCIQEKIRQTT